MEEDMVKICMHCVCSAHDWIMYCCRCKAEFQSYYKEPNFASCFRLDLISLRSYSQTVRHTEEEDE